MNSDSNELMKTAQKNVRLALFWAILAAFGALTVFPYLLALNPSLAENIPFSLAVLAVLQTLQTGILFFFLCWIGLRLGQAIGLDTPFARAFVYGLKPPVIQKNVVVVALLTGAIGGLAIIVLDRLFQPLMPEPLQPTAIEIARWKGLLASFYGGITEELLLRLFLMTLIAWGLWKVAQRSQKPPSPAVFWIASIVAAILFGVGHIPAVASIWPITSIVIVRAIALNSPLGIAFGYIYWQWGLEYAMLAHFCADIVLRTLSGS